MKAADVKRDRRADILAAAMRVLARDGIAQTTTRKIAAEAGLNQATVLYYARSKDDLLLAVLRETMRLTREVVLAASPVGRPPREAMRQCLLAFWAYVEAAPELQVIQYELTLYALRNPDSAWLAREKFTGYCAVVEGLLRDTYSAAGAACMAPFDALARFIVAGLDGLILQFVSDRDASRARGDLAALAASVVALAEEGYAALADRPGTWADPAIS